MGKNRFATTTAVFLAGCILVGCAPQTRSLTPDTQNALGSSKFRFFIVNYPSDNPDSSQGDLYAQIRYDDLIFTKTDSAYMAHYQLSVNLYSDKEMTETCCSKTFDRKVSVTEYSQTMSVRMYDESRDKIVVKPGRYFVGLRLLDLNTNTTSSKEIEYSFKDFFRDSVSISDVVVVDSSGAIPVQFVRGNSTSAGLYVVSKIVPADIPLHVIVKSTRAPTSIDTLYSLKQISRVQYYRLPLNVSGLDAVTYNLRVSAGDESSETAFTKFPNGQPATHAESGSETGPLAYVMTHQQFDSLRSATEQEGEKIKRGFWLERSHGDTVISEAMEREFYKRVDAVDEQFGTTFISGWRTDRGRIYILYGKPDRIENHINSLNAGRAENSSPYEVWYYTSLKLRFTFTDEFRDGNYRLVKTDGT